MHVSELVVYPLKGAAGIQVDAWPVGPLGLELDRRWMLVDPAGRFLSQRVLPRMALLRPNLEAGERLRVDFGRDSLHLPPDPREGAPLEVGIWGDRVEAWAPDPHADHWFSDVLDHPCRLVFLPPESKRPTDPEYAPGHRVAFADGFPLLVVTRAALGELNRRLRRPLPMSRFRPNLVVGGTAEPHAEDGWRRIRAGGVTLGLVKPCARCLVTTVDPGVGRFDGPEPLRTLATYRSRDGKVFFGQNAVVEGGGDEERRRVRVGDPVEVLEEVGDPVAWGP